MAEEKNQLNNEELENVAGGADNNDTGKSFYCTQCNFRFNKYEAADTKCEKDGCTNVEKGKCPKCGNWYSWH